MDGRSAETLQLEGWECSYNISYGSSIGEPTCLNTLDLFKPKNYASGEHRYWIIYIHGGAWRDPLIDAHSILPTLTHNPELSVAGIASINYRLSRYTNHPTHPSRPEDPSRNVQYPEHLRDVITAISWLQKEYGIGERYVLAGHSCGATLAMQVVGRLSLSNGDQQVKSDEGSIALPHAVLGVEGVYDLQLLRNTFRQYPIYQEFIEGAFGADESIWKQVSPVNGQYGRAWPKKKLVVLAHSPEDNLVDGIQTADMANTLKTQGVKVELVKLRGDHDEIWQRGHQMSKAIEETLKYLQD